MKTLVFDAPSHHTLRPEGHKSDLVHGGDEFTCKTKEAEEELLTNPRINVHEAKTQGRKSKGGQKAKSRKSKGGSPPTIQPGADGEGQ